MENKELHPKDSIALITNVIQNAKARYSENGFSFIFLGICISLASLGQFILFQTGNYSINYYPYFIMPVAAIITYFYYQNKYKGVKQSGNMINSILLKLGLTIGLNAMIIGFIFWKILDIALFPVLFLLIGIWGIISGVVIKFRILTIAGIIVNLIAYPTFFLDYSYHPLIVSVVSILALVVPGIILHQNRKNEQV